MTDRHAIEMRDEQASWRARPAILAAIGLVAAVIVQQVLNGTGGAIAPGQLAFAALVGTGAMAFGFGLERLRWEWTIAFAGGAAVVAGLIIWWNGPGNSWPYIWCWPDASLFLAIAIAAPLFQTARDESGWRFPYATVHNHAWTNVLLWFACWAFVGIVFLLAWLLAALFDLIGIDLLTRLLNKNWVDAALIGGAFGAALGLFREREAVVRTLRRVVTAVLSVLGPVLGAGLVLFLFALPFTGLGALWEATKATTPILLTCAFGAWALANTVIGDGAEDEATNPALRWGAIALALVVLPLGVIAAIATGLRIDQYGITPERLWATVFDAVAIAVGFAYWVALVRWRFDWADAARPANLHIAFVVAGIALFLATPILSFNALSAHDQVARLESGKVAPEKFDWAALAFDFGEPGKRALRRLTQSNNAGIARLAAKAAATKDRWTLVDRQSTVERAGNLHKRLRVLPRAVALPNDLQEKVADWNACGGGDRPCTLLWQPGSAEAIAISGDCTPGRKPKSTATKVAIVTNEACSVVHLVKNHEDWTIDSGAGAVDLSDTDRAAVAAALARGDVAIRPVQRRQTFIGGIPVGGAFE